MLRLSDDKVLAGKFIPIIPEERINQERELTYLRILKHRNIVKVEGDYFITEEGVSGGFSELVIIFEMA